MYAPFEDVCQRFATELDGISAQALETHPSDYPDCWNARQIVEHLVLTYRLSATTFQERLKKGRPTQAPVKLNHRMTRFVVLGIGVMPGRRKAPPMVTPAGMPDPVLDGAALVSLFRTELQAMDALLGPCRERFGKQTFANHQVLGPLSAEQWRRFHLVHARHHLKQLQRLSLRSRSRLTSIT
jgi:hypothetical protein